MKRTMTRWLGWLMAGWLALAGTAGAQEEELTGPPIREIEVRFIGPETVGRSVVMANIQAAIGKPRTKELVEQDVRSLIATGFFADVRVLEEPQAGGVKLIYQVQGKATLKEVMFEGNKRYKEDRLRREVSLKPGDVLNEHQAHLDARKILEVYQKAGYANTKVTPEINVDPDTGRAVLKYKVQEAQRVFIRRVIFTGNQAIKSARLAKIMKTKHYWWASWITGSGVAKDEQLREDLDKLREFYWNEGYVDVEIGPSKIEPVSEKYVDLHIQIHEGKQYKVGKIVIEGAKLYPVAQLEKLLQMTSGKVFTPDGLNKDDQAIEDYYGSRGYLDTVVIAQRTANVATGQLDITYKIHEGELIYIERVDIRGNTKTKDKVIRRELAVAPGDVYDTVRVKRSADRLRNLNYFSKVETTPEPTTIPNRRHLAVSVEEQRTGNLTFGAGFSSVDNLLGFVEITQGNFDLFNWPTFTGAGQKLRLRVQYGVQRQDYLLSFTEPWFLDRPLSLGFDLFHRSASYLSDDYEEQRTGGTVRMGKPLGRFTRLDLAYTLQSIDQKITGDGVSEEIKSQSGKATRSSIATTISYDTRDSVTLARRGQRTEFSAELIGGPMGGDVSVYKLNGRSSWYFNLFNDHILQLVGSAGVAEAFGDTKGSGGTVIETVVVGGVTNLVPVKVNDVPMFDRYYLGGADTLRGFEYRDVGPKDVFGEPVGGNTFVHGTIEYTIPVVQNIRFALFFDVGQVHPEAYKFDSGDLAADIGAGVRLNLPVGPLRFDYGFPIKSPEGSGKSGRFNFSAGYQF